MKLLDTFERRQRSDATRSDATMSEDVLKVRFLSKVEVTEGCWMWKGAVRSRDTRPGFPGYGVMNIQQRQHCAHRISWLLYRGEIEDGKEVLHRCDNPLCVNPEHLFLGTKSDNMKDCVSKGRHARAGGAKPGTANGASKLCDEKVILARHLRKKGLSYAEIARRFGVSEATIRPAIKGETWAHVEACPCGCG